MKKIISCLASALVIASFTQSCKKHAEEHGTNSIQTINATLDMNKTYQLDLGDIPNPNALKITQQAAHFSISQTEHSINSENVFYQYTPQLNYSGSDQVTIVVAKEKEHHGKCEHKDHPEYKEHHECNKGHHHEGCKHHHDDDDDDDNTTTYIIKFNVVNTTASPMLNNKAGISN